MAIRTNNTDGSTADFLNAASLRTDPISIMEWVNWYADTGDTQIGVWTGSIRAWRLSAATGPTELRTRISTDGSNQLSTSAATATTNNAWHHQALLYDGTDNEYWLDGVLDATSVDSGGLFASSANLSIGGQEAGGNASDTEHADIRIYNRILSAEEMETIYAARGHDGIVDGLVFRALGREGAIAALVSAANPRDIGPDQIGFDAGYGSPVPSYIEDGGFSFRKRVA